MAKFMLLLGMDPSKRTATASPDYEVVMTKYMEWTKKLKDGGHLLAGHKLVDKLGKVVNQKAGRVVDGPFVESKETVGGYYLLEAKDLEEATELAKACPIVMTEAGWVEVRPVEF